MPLPPTGRVTLWHKARLALEVLGTYAPLLIALRRDDFRRVLAAARDGRCARETADPGDTALRLGSIVGQVLTPLPTDNRCLIRSLVLLRMLARRGIPAELVLGVRGGGEHTAHAWVEHERVALLPVGHFQPLMRL